MLKSVHLTKKKFGTKIAASTANVAAHFVTTTIAAADDTVAADATVVAHAAVAANATAPYCSTASDAMYNVKIHIWIIYILTLAINTGIILSLRAESDMYVITTHRRVCCLWGLSPITAHCSMLVVHE